MTRRIVVVASGRCAVLDVCARRDPLVRSQVVSLTVDRECGAIAVGESLGIPVTRVFERDNRSFSDALLDHCIERQADYLMLFFNRLLAGRLLECYEDRIVNVHGALLPAFKGLHAFEDTLRSGATFLGTTFHLIGEGVDAGPVILQSVLPLDRGVAVEVLRHRQFEQLCKGLIQVCHWIEEGRLRRTGNSVEVAGARFDQPDFSPALEAHEAVHLPVVAGAERT